jgi:leader peptidase (prepilin peptidase)/N-methyltransferase
VIVLAELLLSPAGYVFAFVWGALWGSFANVVIVRLPKGESLMRPPSRCMACGTPIRFYDNIPIFSYLIRRGRCRACGARFSPRYMLVEQLMGLIAIALWWRALGAPAAALSVRQFMIEFLFTGTLTVLSFIDLELMILPDRITLPGIVVFFVLGFWEPGVPAWWHRLIGIVVGWGFVWCLAEAFYRITGREGLGLGDGKLLALVAALLGWQALWACLFLGAVQGLLVTVPARLASRRKVMGVEIPFGPFLALGAVEYLFLASLMREFLPWTPW